MSIESRRGIYGPRGDDFGTSPGHLIVDEPLIAVVRIHEAHRGALSLRSIACIDVLPECFALDPITAPSIVAELDPAARRECLFEIMLARAVGVGRPLLLAMIGLRNARISRARVDEHAGAIANEHRNGLGALLLKIEAARVDGRGNLSLPHRLLLRLTDGIAS